jgi:hypothetical protein
MIVMHSNSFLFSDLGGRLESGRETLDVVGKVALVAEELNVGTVDLDLTGVARVDVLLTLEGSESPVLGDNDLLATRELRTISAVVRLTAKFDIPCTGNASEPQEQRRGWNPSSEWTSGSGQC